MDLYSNLAGSNPLAALLAVLVLGIVATVVSLGVIAEFVATNHRARVARHESIRTYYHRIALTH
jgi:hypothetical protein